MANLDCVISIEDTLTGAATPKTMLQLVAPADQRVKVKAWGIFCKGTVTTNTPLLVQLIRQTGAGTSSANTPAKKNEGIADGPRSTARDTFTVEPASDDEIVKTVDVHPQSGFNEYFPLGGELIVPSNGRLGIKVTAVNDVSVSCFFDFEE